MSWRFPGQRTSLSEENWIHFNVFSPTGVLLNQRSAEQLPSLSHSQTVSQVGMSAETLHGIL